MDDKLKAKDVVVVDGSLVVSLPDDGTVLVPGDELFKLAAEKGRPLPDDKEETEGSSN